MHLSFQASPKMTGDWVFLEMLRDPSKKWRVDVYGQAMGEGKWLPLFSKVVGLSDEPSDMEAGVSSARVSAAPSAPLVGPWEMPNEEMSTPEIVEGYGSVACSRL